MRGYFFTQFEYTKIMYNPKYYQAHRDRIRNYNKDWRDNRIKNGLCIVCNNPISANSKCFCDSCLTKNRQNHQEPAKKSGRKLYQYYLTVDENTKLKAYLEELRAPLK